MRLPDLSDTALREEAMNLASILSGMVEGGYSDLETLYTEYQVDGDAFVKRAAEVLDLLASASPAPRAEQHPDDAAVDRFAAAMKDKLAIARQKGRGGWETYSAEGLGRMLREHVEKGDPRDVANFCMFLWSLGHGIAPQASVVQQEPVAWICEEQIIGPNYGKKRLTFSKYYSGNPLHYRHTPLYTHPEPQAKSQPLSDDRDARIAELERELAMFPRKTSTS